MQIQRAPKHLTSSSLGWRSSEDRQESTWILSWARRHKDITLSWHGRPDFSEGLNLPTLAYRETRIPPGWLCLPSGSFNGNYQSACCPGSWFPCEERGWWVQHARRILESCRGSLKASDKGSCSKSQPRNYVWWVSLQSSLWWPGSEALVLGAPRVSSEHFWRSHAEPPVLRQEALNWCAR